MTTITFSLMIVVLVIFLFIGFTYINNKQKKKADDMLLSQLSKSGTENNLSFSRQEIINDSILGLDGVQSKLLILRKSDKGMFEWNIIDLDWVKNCSVKKIYKPFYEDIPKEKTNEKYLDKIALHFEFVDNRESMDVNFYRHITNSIYEMPELELKARKWESLLLPVTGTRLKQIA